VVVVVAAARGAIDPQPSGNGVPLRPEWPAEPRSKMPAPHRKKLSASLDRGARLRQSRVHAKTLRDSFPRAALVDLHLRFQPTDGQEHAAQSFRLYPGALAFFEYPCPYGDCDGTYDLSGAVGHLFAGGAPRAEGTAACAGTRSRDGKARQPCALDVSYSITAQLEESTSRR
jgi:hypothetical protein